MAENPFQYGIVVTGDNFVNRDEEIKILYKELSSGKSIVLYSERRLGKTSLIMEFIAQKGRKLIPVYIDLYGMTAKEKLAKQIVNQVINKCYTKLEKIKEALKDFFSYLRPKLIISPDGTLTIDVGVERKYKEEELIEILDFPQKIAHRKKNRIVMIFDEFQEIAMMDGEEIEKLMRSRFQHHKNVSYLFAGSKKHLLHQIFEERTRAFFKFARPLQLGVISCEKFHPFIYDKFKLTGGKPSEHIINKILDYTKGHPYFTQYLCHEIWYITKSPKNEEVIETALQNITAQQSVAYEHIWDELKSPNQRLLLIGIASENGYNYSTEFIEKYRLKSQSHVEKSLKLLKNRGILDDHGNIIDIFFKEWIVRCLIKNKML